LRPLAKESIVYTVPDLDLSRLNQLRNSLSQLVTDIGIRNDAIREGIQDLANRFDEFESPIGKIPLGFSEAIAVFSLLIAVGFFIYSFVLRQVMALYNKLEGRYPDLRSELEVNRFVSFLARISH
jgi:hypothetical protein